MSENLKTEIVAAFTLAEVLPALRAVEEAARGGRWAQGFTAYEAAPAFDSALVVRAPLPGLPLLYFALSDCPPNTQLNPQRSRLRERKTGDPITQSPNHPPLEFLSDTSPAEWERAVAAVHEAIGRGETYQVNLTRRLRAAWPDELDARAVYERLLAAQSGTPYAAFVDIGRFQILSVSPELFFAVEGDRLTTRPMKGTARRGRWLEEDNANAAALAASQKERAENVMIVDLLRNDLGKIAVPGTVRVPELFAVERYPTALQMTSTVTAQKRPGVGLTEIFTALFPCGSVTGAPKVRTMGKIAALEKSARGVYCGAVGVVKPGGDAVFNVAIRTLVIDRETRIAEYGVGGGIVWDSTPEREWAETETKSAILTATPPPEFDLLETLRLENGDYGFLARHLDRLQATAAHFRRPCDTGAIKAALSALAAAHPTNAYRVRLIVAPDGTPRLESAPVGPPFIPLSKTLRPATCDLRFVSLAALPVSRNDVFLCHKTTHRAAYDDARRDAPPDVFDVLLWNEEGEATEFTIGNLVAEIEGKLWTPPRDCGLLNGVYRDELLAQGIIRERILTLADVKNAARLSLINGVRGATSVFL